MTTQDRKIRAIDLFQMACLQEEPERHWEIKYQKGKWVVACHQNDLAEPVVFESSEVFHEAVEQAYIAADFVKELPNPDEYLARC